MPSKNALQQRKLWRAAQREQLMRNMSAFHYELRGVDFWFKRKKERKKRNAWTEVRKKLLWNIPGGIRGILPHDLHSNSRALQLCLPNCTATTMMSCLSLPHTTETAVACSARCPAVTHAIGPLAYYSYKLLSYGDSSWIARAEQSFRLWWSTDLVKHFFFPAM